MLRKNPIKAAREMLGLSISQVAAFADLHRAVIIRSEQGCYASIPPRLYSFLVGRLGEGDPSIALDYQRWVGEKRADSFGQLSSRLPDYIRQVHPFVQWREYSDLNRNQFCKAFCVNTGTVIRFENNIVQQTVPDQLIEALAEAGYPQEIIQELHIRYRLYRNITLAASSGDEERISTAMRMADEHARMIVAA